jgi:hypothetical protein
MYGDFRNINNCFLAVYFPTCTWCKAINFPALIFVQQWSGFSKRYHCSVYCFIRCCWCKIHACLRNFHRRFLLLDIIFDYHSRLTLCSTLHISSYRWNYWRFTSNKYTIQQLSYQYDKRRKVVAVTTPDASVIVLPDFTNLLVCSETKSSPNSPSGLINLHQCWSHLHTSHLLCVRKSVVPRYLERSV